MLYMVLSQILEKSAEDHKHLCPRQILGVRMGMLAGELLSLDLPQKNKRLLCFVETDGCFVDGITAATGCSMGHRTMRLMDYGKVAACFIDSQTQKAFRISPRTDSRQIAQNYEASSPWLRYLEAYQTLPAASLFCVTQVQLNISLEKLISHPRHRMICANCYEEIINERERLQEGRILCQACANGAYYTYCERLTF
jgi:formylmethanofuran dehydrogenase subunit E